MQPSAPDAEIPRTVLLVFEPPDGGVTENVLQLALRMAESGWTAVVAGPERSIVRARLEDAGIEYVPIPPLRRGFGRPDADFQAMRLLESLLRSGRFTVVHCHASKAGFLGRIAAARAGVPAIYSPHCFGFVGDVSAKRRLFSLTLERGLGHLTAGLLCVSEAERRLALESGVDGSQTTRCITHGVDVPTSSGIAQELLDFKGDGLLVGAVTVLREQKRLDVLIDAAPRVLEAVPHARFAIVGNGPQHDELEARAAAHGLLDSGAIRFFDFTPPSAQFLRALDLYVLPSAWEAMPIGALEAMACGVPQVISRLEGMDEIVTPETGVLVEPKDVGDLAEALIGLLRDDARRERAAQASVERGETVFQLDRMVRETADFYGVAAAASSATRSRERVMTTFVREADQSPKTLA